MEDYRVLALTSEEVDLLHSTPKIEAIPAYCSLYHKLFGLREEIDGVGSPIFNLLLEDHSYGKILDVLARVPPVDALGQMRRYMLCAFASSFFDRGRCVVLSAMSVKKEAHVTCTNSCLPFCTIEGKIVLGSTLGGKEPEELTLGQFYHAKRAPCLIITSSVAYVPTKKLLDDFCVRNAWSEFGCLCEWANSASSDNRVLEAMLLDYATRAEEPVITNIPDIGLPIAKGCIVDQYVKIPPSGSVTINQAQAQLQNFIFAKTKPVSGEVGTYRLIAPGHRLQSHPASRSSGVKYLFGILTLSSLFFNASASCLDYSGHTICNFSDYVNAFSGLHSFDGPYMVCFSNLCIPRCRSGNDTKSRCGKGQVFPYRCPSPDWSPSCVTEDCRQQCSQCKYSQWTDRCQFSLRTRDDYDIYTLPHSNTSITFSDDDNRTAYFPDNKGSISMSKEYWQVIINDAHNYTTPVLALSYLKLVLACILALVGIAIFVVYIVRWALSLNNKYKEVPQEEMEDLVSQKENNAAEQVKTESRLPKDFILILIMLCTLSFSVGVAYADQDAQTWEEYLDANRTATIVLPSVCSCSNTGDMISQLRCITGCNDELRVMNSTFRMHFDLNIVCYPKKLYILQELHEKTCCYCKGGASEKWCAPYENYNILNSEWGEYQHDCDKGVCDYTCFISKNAVHKLWWSERVFDAELCYATDPVSPYIEGLPDTTAYTYVVHSTLKSQSSFIKVYADPIVYYKVINGGVGSNRAWLVNPDQVLSNGHPNPRGSLYNNIISKRRYSLSNSDMDKKIDHSLDNFYPEVFSEDCKVDVTYNSMRCYTLPEVCQGTCRIVMGHTQFKAKEHGQCHGVYVSKDFWQEMPSGIKCNSDCSAGPSGDGAGAATCTAEYWNSTLANYSGSNESVWEPSAIFFDDFQAKTTYSLAAIAGLLIIIIIVIIIIRCACHC